MQSKVLPTFAEAVADIPNGASILLAGFGPGTPWNLIRALHQQGASELTLIANTAGGGATTPVPGIVNAGHLVEDNRVRKVILAFTASTHPSRQSPLEKLHEAG